MRRHAPDAVALLGVVGFVSAIGLTISNHSLPAAVADETLITLMTCGFAFSIAIGWLVLRRTGNVIGWIFLSFGTAGVLWAASGEYLVHAFGVGSLPATTLVAVSGNVVATAMGAPLALVCLLFPSGSIPSPKWRPVLWAWVVGAATMLAWSVIRPGEIWGAQDRVAGTVVGPFSVPAWVSSGLLTIGVTLLLGAGFAAVVSLILRSRRARGEERQQIRWLKLVAATVAILLAGLLGTQLLLTPFHLNGRLSDAVGNVVFAVIALLIVFGMPAAVAIAILKYRLYDIDVVIRKTVVFGVLAAFITLVYVVIVEGLGSLFSGTLLLRIAATALVAVAFQPVRDRANRFANRIVYGDRATPYEVLARFGERVGETYASEDVLPRVARVIAEGTAAARADVWLRLGDALTLAASSPASGTEAAVAIRDDELPAIAGDRVAPVRHQGELLGAIAVTKPTSEPLTAGEAELLDRLADQAGLVLANARLTTDLEARLTQIAGQAADLRASRQRIVAAQDEERRKLERNIHDGAQQHLVALAVKLRLAKGALQKDPAIGRRMLGEIRGEVDAALDTLRSLALGIYPPLLEEQGIAAALAAQYTRGHLPVRMDTDGIGRYPIEIEAAVYFCTLEALQNAAKYAHASTITITLHEHDGTLEFSVADDGVGFDPASNGSGIGTGVQGMRDRISVFGGDAEIESAPGEGTTVRGRVPIAERVSA